MTKKIRTLLVDDSFQARELLRFMLIDLAPSIEVVGEAENVDSAIQLIRELKVDLVFLDIEMPEKSGLDLLVELSEEELKFEVIFTTAYNQYAIEAFRLSAIDYLLKPIRENHLLEAIERVSEIIELRFSAQKLAALITNFNQTKNGMLSISVANGNEFIALNEIEFFEADGSYTVIHLSDESKKLVSKNMGYFVELLQTHENFFKTHRSFFVNIHYVIKLDNKSETAIATLKSGKKAEISRNNKKEFMLQFQR